jgi:hypothetical protein
MNETKNGECENMFCILSICWFYYIIDIQQPIEIKYWSIDNLFICAQLTVYLSSARASHRLASYVRIIFVL